MSQIIQGQTQNQPEITIQKQDNSSHLPKSSNNSQEFYQIMDEVDRYDDQLTKLSDKLTQSMLSLANIKFLNPYILSSFSFKPTPALLKLNTQTNQLVQEQKPQFICNRVIQTEQSDYQQIQQCQQQAQIQQNLQKVMKQQKNSQNRLQNIMCDRFNIMNQSRQVVKASKMFRNVLQQCLQLIQVRNQVYEEIKAIENRKER